jgi:hypothetical protein
MDIGDGDLLPSKNDPFACHWGALQINSSSGAPVAKVQVTGITTMYLTQLPSCANARTLRFLLET